ncbi:hypothetical protein H0H93_011202, partial [Arthromyces matolae]
MFSLSIQIRILRSVQEGERRRREEGRVLIGILRGGKGVGGGVGGEGDGDGVGLGLEVPRKEMEVVTPGMGGSESVATVMPKTPTLSHSSTLVHPSSSTSSSQFEPPTTTPLQLPPPLPLPAASQVLPTIKDLHSTQDKEDKKRDVEELKSFLRSALRGDAEMLDVLGITREEMPEAIKTLQRALESVGEGGVGGVGGGDDKVNSGIGTGNGTGTGSVISTTSKGESGKGEKRRWGLGIGGKRSGEKARVVEDDKVSSSSAPGHEGEDDDDEDDGWEDVTLDREFIESGIDALRRMSRGAGIPTSSLPPWTITRYEVDREQKIG